LRKKKEKKILDKETKQKLSLQLCGLLRSSVQCLKGGQSLQYTSLLLINKIIDTLIIYDISQFPIEFDEKTIVITTQEKEQKSKNKINATHKKQQQNVSQIPTIKATKKQIISSLKKTSHSSSLKENKKSELNASNQQKFANRSINNENCENSNERTKWSNWIKGKTRSIKTNSNKSNNISANSTLGKHCATKKESNTFVTESNAKINTSLLSILVKEGIDLILNVLNNAITLHKRVTGSKQSCTPSHR
jgi:Zn-dependent metalloprotease